MINQLALDVIQYNITRYKTSFRLYGLDFTEAIGALDDCVLDIHAVLAIDTFAAICRAVAPYAEQVEGDTAYDYCPHCLKSTLQHFDGKDWICSDCRYTVPNVAAPEPVGGDSPKPYIPANERCGFCAGTGAGLGFDEKCEGCNGTGRKQGQRRDYLEAQNAQLIHLAETQQEAMLHLRELLIIAEREPIAIDPKVLQPDEHTMRNTDQAATAPRPADDDEPRQLMRCGDLKPGDYILRFDGNWSEVERTKRDDAHIEVWVSGEIKPRRFLADMMNYTITAKAPQPEQRGPAATRLSDVQSDALKAVRDCSVTRHWMADKYVARNNGKVWHIRHITMQKLIKLGMVVESKKSGDWHTVTITDAGKQALKALTQ